MNNGVPFFWCVQAYFFGSKNQVKLPPLLLSPIVTTKSQAKSPRKDLGTTIFEEIAFSMTFGTTQSNEWGY